MPSPEGLLELSGLASATTAPSKMLAFVTELGSP